MISRNVAIIIGILILVALGFMFVSTTTTGNVITGFVSSDEVIRNEYFRISDFGNEEGEKGVDDNGKSRSG